MSVEENRAIVRRFVEEVQSGGDIDAIDELCSPEFINHTAPPGVPSNCEGIKQVMAMFRQAFPDSHFAVEDMVAEGDKVVVRFRGRGTHQGETEAFGPPTGKRMEITGITIKRLSEGKIVEAWTNFDALGMMQQLGLIPEPAQAES